MERMITIAPTHGPKNNTEFLINFAKYYKIKYAITYFYNVYGDREIEDGKYATVIAKFIKLKSKKTKYLEITRPGTQRRNFTHVKDIISGLVKVAENGMVTVMELHQINLQYY